MTTLEFRKADKAELQAHIDGEIAAYKLTLQGRDNYLDAYGRIVVTDFNKYGAIITIANTVLPSLLFELQEKIDQGYRLDTSGTYAPVCSPVGGVSKFYLVKPEAPAVVDGQEQRITGVSYQVDDIEALKKEAAVRYEQEIEDHNEKVFAQTAEIIRQEQAQEAAQQAEALKLKEASDFERLVRERAMRGSKPAKAPAKAKATEEQAAE